MGVRTAKEAHMWLIAGILLGLAVAAALSGFHVGPHMHAAAGVLAVVAAVWLLVVASTGSAPIVLWVLFAAALVVGAGTAVIAWYALTGRGMSPGAGDTIEGAEGVAVGDLTPDGLVQVRGEQWSATVVNGTARRGTRIQVLRVAGLHLDVWAEEPDQLAAGGNGSRDPSGAPPLQ